MVKRRPRFNFDCNANVYRDLQVVYREMRVRRLQIYGDCMLKLRHSEKATKFENLNFTKIVD